MALIPVIACAATVYAIPNIGCPLCLRSTECSQDDCLLVKWQMPRLLRFIGYYSRSGDRFMADNDFDSAIQAYSAAIEEEPETADLLYRRGIALAARNTVTHSYADLLRAQADFTSAAKLEPRAEYRLSLADIHQHLGDAEAALDDYKSIITTWPDNELVYTRLSEFLFCNCTGAQIAGHTAALQAFEDQILTHEGRLAGPFVARGMIRSLLGEREPAIDDYSRAIAIDPRFQIAYVRRGKAYVDGRIADAQRDFDRAVRLRASAEALRLRGELRLKYDESDAAGLADLKKALEVEPHTISNLISLGAIYAANNYHTEAAEAYRRATEHGYLDTTSQYYDAAMKSNGLDRFIEVMTSVANANPQSVAPLHDLGRALLAQDRTGEAITALSQVAERSPYWASAHHQLGLAYYKAADFPRARDCFQTSIDLSKSDDSIVWHARSNLQLGDAPAARSELENFLQTNGGSALRREAEAVLATMPLVLP